MELPYERRQSGPSSRRVRVTDIAASGAITPSTSNHRYCKGIPSKTASYPDKFTIFGSVIAIILKSYSCSPLWVVQSDAWHLFRGFKPPAEIMAGYVWHTPNVHKVLGHLNCSKHQLSHPNPIFTFSSRARDSHQYIFPFETYSISKWLNLSTFTETHEPVPTDFDSIEKTPQPSSSDGEDEEIQYPSGRKVAVIMIALCLAMFLITLVIIRCHDLR